MINEHLYKRFEEETISKVNRFEISKKDLNELKESFKNKIVLISGAAGSIGSQFPKDIFKYNFKIKKNKYKLIKHQRKRVEVLHYQDMSDNHLLEIHNKLFPERKRTKKSNYKVVTKKS